MCLFDMQRGRVVGVMNTGQQDNEEILGFTVSPNEQLLAMSNKNYMVKVFKMPSIEESEIISE